jgi:Lrp/AsnC family leucine-responsive transcriptional regulator
LIAAYLHLGYISVMDSIDRRILEELQRDSRQTNLQLAERVGLSPSPCLRRVRALEAGGVIERYVAELNRSALGLDLTVFVTVTVDHSSGSDTASTALAISAMSEVIAFYVVSGRHDILLQVVVPHIAAFRRFTLNRLLKVSGVRCTRRSKSRPLERRRSAVAGGVKPGQW